MEACPAREPSHSSAAPLFVVISIFQHDCNNRNGGVRCRPDLVWAHGAGRRADELFCAPAGTWPHPSVFGGALLSFCVSGDLDRAAWTRRGRGLRLPTPAVA